MEFDPALRRSNEMQVALVNRRYGFTSNEAAEEWIGQYAGPFHKLVVEQHPEIVERFATDPDAALAAAEELLYENAPGAARDQGVPEGRS